MSDKIMWVCGKITSEENWKQFTIHGIFDDEEKAVGACKDDSFFIGPVPLNIELPVETVEWFGAYYPLEKKE